MCNGYLEGRRRVPLFRWLEVGGVGRDDEAVGLRVCWREMVRAAESEEFISRCPERKMGLDFRGILERVLGEWRESSVTVGCVVGTSPACPHSLKSAKTPVAH